ncbi:MAG: hypothetical protein ACREUQ_02540, partial [Burkholderiales bacterium]
GLRSSRSQRGADSAAPRHVMRSNGVGCGVAEMQPSMSKPLSSACWCLFAVDLAEWFFPGSALMLLLFASLLFEARFLLRGRGRLTTFYPHRVS